MSLFEYCCALCGVKVLFDNVFIREYNSCLLSTRLPAGYSFNLFLPLSLRFLYQTKQCSKLAIDQFEECLESGNLFNLNNITRLHDTNDIYRKIAFMFTIY